MKIEEEDIDMKYICLAFRLYEVTYIIHKMQSVIYNGWSVMRNSYEAIICIIHMITFAVALA